MPYGASQKSRNMAVASAATRVKNFITARRSIGSLPVTAARQSTRTHLTNPERSVSPLRGGAQIR